MARIMQGVRILEVAQHTFVPVAGAILADWGADVVKIEHPVRGDTMRGFRSTGGVQHNPNRHTLVEQANRGKRSVGVDVSKPQGQQLIYEIARTADVFLTNYLPAQRQKLKLDIEHIRAANPKIIYARGSAYGDKGPEREVGGFDGTAFWTRSGIGYSMTPEVLEQPLMQGIPAFGDCIGGMNIAGGIMGALFHRERTGEAIELDVSLMSTAWWAAGSGMAQVMETGIIPRTRMSGGGGSPGNPFMGNFTTSDGGTLNFCTLTPGPYIRDIFTHLGMPEAADDPRFANVEALMKGGRQRTHGAGDRQTAFQLLARTPQNDEGTMGAVLEPRRPGARCAGGRQRHDHRGRGGRRRTVKIGAAADSIPTRGGHHQPRAASLRTHRKLPHGTRAGLAAHRILEGRGRHQLAMRITAMPTAASARRHRSWSAWS